MKNRLMYSAPLLALLLVSVVSASILGGYSLRGSDGDIVFIGNENNFSFEKASFSAYVSPGSAGTGQGAVLITAVTTDGDRINLGVKLQNAVVLIDDANTLRVQSDGYYYERVKTWNGFWTLNKVEGKVTYTYNKNTGLTNVVGSNGLSFRVNGLETVNLR